MSVNIITGEQSGDVYFVPYKSYVALLNQSDTDNETPPVATVLNANDSNYLGDIVWTYDGVGFYLGTLANAFPLEKTFIITSSTANSFAVTITNNEVGVPSSQIFCKVSVEGSLTLTDGQLYNTPIEIRVYP